MLSYSSQIWGRVRWAIGVNDAFLVILVTPLSFHSRGCWPHGYQIYSFLATGCHFSQNVAPSTQCPAPAVARCFANSKPWEERASWFL